MTVMMFGQHLINSLYADIVLNSVNQLLFAFEKICEVHESLFFTNISHREIDIKCLWYIIFRIIYILIAKIINVNHFISGKLQNKVAVT